MVVLRGGGLLLMSEVPLYSKLRPRTALRSCRKAGRMSKRTTLGAVRVLYCERPLCIQYWHTIEGPYSSLADSRSGPSVRIHSYEQAPAFVIVNYKFELTPSMERTRMAARAFS